MALLTLRIYDNGGKSIDRYTLIMPDGEAWGFSDNPYHPQGFGQYAGSLRELRTFSHLGKPIKSILDLPREAGKFVDEIATADGDTYIVAAQSRGKFMVAGRPKSKAKRKPNGQLAMGGMR